MSPFLEELLWKVQGTQIDQRDYLEDGWVNSGYVFSQPDGKPIDPDLITKAFNNMVEEIGVPHLTPHGLRHQFATAAREAGIEMDIISKNLGHASVATTLDIYAHSFQTLKSNANECLGDWMDHGNDMLDGFDLLSFVFVRSGIDSAIRC